MFSQFFFLNEVYYLRIFPEVPRCIVYVSAEYLEDRGLGCAVQLAGKCINLCPKVKTAQLPGSIRDNAPFLIISPFCPWWGSSVLILHTNLRSISKEAWLPLLIPHHKPPQAVTAPQSSQDTHIYRLKTGAQLRP